MAARRKGRSGAKVLSKQDFEDELVVDVKPAKAANDLGATKKVEAPAGDFFPPGFEDPKLPPVKDSELVTYFLQTDLRGFRLYEPHAVKYLHSGFRAVIVGPPTFIFDKPVTKLVGRMRGDHFTRAVVWAKSNVVADLHNRYKLAGGGTPIERERALKRYTKARQLLVAHHEKLALLEKEVEESAVALVERFGKGPLIIDGETWDPSYVREQVYWKRRHVP